MGDGVIFAHHGCLSAWECVRANGRVALELLRDVACDDQPRVAHQ
jgi:hypothetical protein